MSDKMNDEQINKIAEAIAAKLSERPRPALLGCGNASSTSDYNCNTYNCDSSSYYCGGAGAFDCGYFTCFGTFVCRTGFSCYSGATFQCRSYYNT